MKKIEELFHLYRSTMIITDSEKEQFWQATVCHICEQPFTKDDAKVADHCHYTGKFRDAAHRYCNIALKVNDKLIIAFFEFDRLRWASNNECIAQSREQNHICHSE